MFSIFSHQATWILRQTRLGCNTPRYQEVRFPNWQFCTRHPLHPCWSWHPEMAKLAYLGVFLQRKNGLIFFKTEKSWGWNKRWQDVFFWEWTLWPQQGVACKKWKGWVWTRRKGEFGNFHFDFFLWNWGKIHFTSYPNTRHPQVFHWKIGYSWVSFNSKLFELRRRFKTIKDKDSAVVRRTTIFEALRWCMVRTWEESHEDETHT